MGSGFWNSTRRTADEATDTSTLPASWREGGGRSAATVAVEQRGHPALNAFPGSRLRPRVERAVRPVIEPSFPCEGSRCQPSLHTSFGL